MQRLESTSATVVTATCPVVQARLPYDVLRSGMELGEAMLWARGPPMPPAGAALHDTKVPQVGGAC